MSSKESLRQLQVRLAERLQAAREQPRQAGWLAVECAGAGLLFPLAQAGEIHAAGTFVPVAHARPWLAGVVNLRGQLHAVVDLAAFLGLREASAKHPTGSQLVALNGALHVNCALWVDRLVGLRDDSQLTRAEAYVASTTGVLPEFAGATWRDELGNIWQELNLSALAQDARFLNVAAG